MRCARYITHFRRISDDSVRIRTRILTRTFHDQVGLTSILRRNKELTESDAENELRWIRQAIKEDSTLSTDESGRLRSFQETLLALVTRRSQGEPLQYILGSTDFGPLTLKVRRPTLIPRPETEYITSLLAKHILSQRQHPTQSLRPLNILDLCTGSGCIALLLAHRLCHQAQITGIDISPDAIALAKENAEHTGSENVKFRLGDLWGEMVVGDKIDLIVSNPPYIPRKEWDELDTSVRQFEDPLALVGDPADVPMDAPRRHIASSDIGTNDGKGLSFYRRIAQLLPGLLSDTQALQTKGWNNLPRVAVEIGYGQSADVTNIFLDESGGIINRVEVWKDQYDVERMVVGWT